MLVFTSCSVVLLYTVARRLHLARVSAALAVLLFGLSPLATTLQRQIFLDNVAVTWILAAFVLALSPRRHLWSHVGAGVCAAIACLSKENMLVVLPAVILALWQNTHPSTRSFSVVGFFWCGFGLVSATFPLFAILKGELVPGTGHVSLIDGVTFQLLNRKGSGSVLDSTSDAHAVLQTWLDKDPVFLAIGAVAVLGSLAVRHLRAPAVAGTLIILVALRPTGYLPAMYVIQALPFFALCAAGLVQMAIEATRSNRKLLRPMGLAAICVSMVVAVIGLAPRWVDGTRQALTVSSNDDFARVSQWIRVNVNDPAQSRILVDDNLWLDMVEIGFVPGTGAIWFNKLDLDPAVAATVPGGWRDIDYLISTPGLRHALKSETTLPTVAAVVEHSHVVAIFGTQPNTIEIRKVLKDNT